MSQGEGILKNKNKSGIFNISTAVQDGTVIAWTFREGGVPKSELFSGGFVHKEVRKVAGFDAQVIVCLHACVKSRAELSKTNRWTVQLANEPTSDRVDFLLISAMKSKVTSGKLCVDLPETGTRNIEVTFVRLAQQSQRGIAHRPQGSSSDLHV